MKRISALCLLALAPAIGMASIIPTSTAVTATGTGTFKWSYGLSLASDQNVNGGFLPITTTIVPRENAGRGGFLTLYDFEGYVAGSCTSPAGWTCSVQRLGYTPNDVVPIDKPLFDNPLFDNITWAYTTGAAVLSQPTGVELGLFSAVSMYDQSKRVSFAARGVKSKGVSAGPIADSVGTTLAPMAPGDVPEPGSLALAGLGLLLMVRMRAAAQA